MKKTFMLSTLVLALTTVVQPVLAKESSGKVIVTENAAIVLEKARADKKYLVSRNMIFTDSESKAFWPLYESYQDEIHKINMLTAGLITEYASAYTAKTMTDAIAARLMSDLMSIEADELTLKKSYFAKFQRILPAAKAARYMQIENKVRAIVKLKLSEQIPLVESQSH